MINEEIGPGLVVKGVKKRRRERCIHEINDNVNSVHNQLWSDKLLKVGSFFIICPFYHKSRGISESNVFSISVW